MSASNKVYLSKSNHSNPDQVMKVRKWLDEKGFTVIEHTGGPYDESLLEQANTMVMVGCNSIRGATTIVGKGQYNQLKFRRTTRGFSNNYYVTGLYHGNAILRRVTLGGIVDEDNWTNGYGTLRIKTSVTIRISPNTEPKEVKSSNPLESIDEADPEQKVDIFDPRTRAKHLACIILLTNT